MAGAKVTGDFLKLKRLAAKMEDITRPAFRREGNKRLSEATIELVHESFEKSITPDGKKWAPLKVRRGQPLRDTGRLLASITPRSSASGFSVGTNVIYAAVHQFGFKAIPRRQYLPTMTRLPSRYRGRYAAELRALRGEWLGR